MDDGQGGQLNPVSADSEITMHTSKTFTRLTKGNLYRFSCRVKNINGWSDMSEITTIRTAIVPGQPQAPVLLSASATMLSLKFF